jgi:hypothetical protein
MTDKTYGLKLWIDDLREAPDPTWETITTSDAAIAFLNFWKDQMESALFPFEVVSFDHDLGGDDTTRPVVIWMIENNVRFNEYRVHSANPVGVQWLTGMIERYLK